MIGQTLKNYVVEAALGRGGMGVVYRARDTRLERNVALKVLPPELVRDEARRQRFVQEAKAASAVNHPAIAQIYELETEGETTFIVMEYVDGSTVRELVARRELDIGAALEVGIQVADALARAHEAGIVHRDIKSDNIMVTRDGHPKILDFGLAKLLAPALVGGGLGDASQASHLETLAVTQAGMVLGTVAYMSPEQARGLSVDKRSDIFSLGVVLYEMCTGKVPFQGASALDTMHAIAFSVTQPVTVLRPDLPFSLQRVVDRCLQKKPEDRYQDMRDLVADLRSVKREMDSGTSGGKPVLERARSWVGSLTSRGKILAVVLGALAGAYLVSSLGHGGDIKLYRLIPFLAVGYWLFWRFRNRPHREVSRFVKRATSLKEVRLVTFVKGHFTVVADRPTAKTYLKLNDFLSSANKRLFQGEPMTMVVREDLGEAETRTLLSSPGVQYVRDDR